MGDSGGYVAKAVANDRRLILREQMELYVEAAIALRDIVSMVAAGRIVAAEALTLDDLHAHRVRIDQLKELKRRATAILEQLGLKP